MKWAIGVGLLILVLWLVIAFVPLWQRSDIAGKTYKITTWTKIQLSVGWVRW